MKTLFATLLLALSVPAVLAQEKTTDVDFHVVSLDNEEDVPLGHHYYVERVYDGRQIRDNIGAALKGAFNKRVPAKFGKPLEQEIMGYFNKVLPKRSDASPISIRINELYVAELSISTRETGYATVVMDVIENRDGADYILSTLSARVEGNGLDVTHKHDERIKKALTDCLSNYEALHDNEKTAIPFRHYELRDHNIAAIPAKGIYISYTELAANAPKDDAGFSMEQEEGLYHLVNNNTGQPAENYYAYSDGETLYLNVSKYALIKYYEKAEKMGGKYFIKDVVFDINNAEALNATLGLGSMVATPLPGSMICVLVDCTSGDYVLLSNSEVKDILSDKRELLKEYKKSERSSHDIRNVLSKYYGTGEAK